MSFTPPKIIKIKVSANNIYFEKLRLNYCNFPLSKNIFYFILNKWYFTKKNKSKTTVYTVKNLKTNINLF